MSFDIDLAACRARQKRLLNHMHLNGIDLSIITQHEHVQYFVGPRFAWTHSPAAAISASGKVTLVAPNKPPASAAADDIVTYEAQWHSTLRNDQRRACSEVLLKALAGQTAARKVGLEFANASKHFTDSLKVEFVDIEPQIYAFRRKKDPDELVKLRKAIAATGKMYAKAREMVRPGVNELDVFNELQAVAVRDLGEMLTGTGNDYACNARGGPPRDRKAEAGELYILDLGPAYQGYFADNCRAISVDGKPTAPQMQAWEALAKALDHVKATVKPGKSCRQLFHEVQTMLNSAPVGKFDHHLGHGIGLFPHEGPHLNPRLDWDDTFQVGDVFTAEPGLYAPELKQGIRLENDYLVTETGVEVLSDFPLGLT